MREINTFEDVEAHLSGAMRNADASSADSLDRSNAYVDVDRKVGRGTLKVLAENGIVVSAVCGNVGKEGWTRIWFTRIETETREVEKTITEEETVATF